MNKDFTILSDEENYFILLLFCRSRFLLSKANRKLYDALFEKYKKVYQEGRKQHIDLSDINDKFINSI